jgi:peroxiredoxin Q/BCP
MLKEGTQAPDFELVSDAGKTVRLSDFRGKKVVLYFYPKDNTPGCTKEACSFRDEMPKFDEDVVVLGVSRDSVQSHKKFKEKYQLNFPLLSDPEGRVCEAYGVIGEKKRYGRTYIGVFRVTFVIDETGKIIRVFNKVKPEIHAKEVREYLESLQG